MLSFITGKDYQKEIDKYNKQLEDPDINDDEKEQIQQKLETAQENLVKAQEKAEIKDAKKAANEKTLAKNEAAKKQAEEDAARKEEEHKIKVLGGFFVYRAKPTSESQRIESILSSNPSGEEGFAQKGEITGMVLVKQSGNRQFMTYAPIDPKTYTVDKFMEYFKDTMYNNKYDDNIEKVFELEAVGTLINKLIVQTVEE